MKVREIMSREVRTVTPQTTLGEAALLMRQADVGALLVNEGERLTGVVTDRDLAVRGLADGLGADRPVREVMSGELRYCFEDEEVDHVAKNMAQLEKRRLPVMDRNKRLVGIARWPTSRPATPTSSAPTSCAAWPARTESDMTERRVVAICGGSAGVGRAIHR